MPASPDTITINRALFLKILRALRSFAELAELVASAPARAELIELVAELERAYNE